MKAIKHLLSFLIISLIAIACNHSPESALNTVININSAEEDIRVITDNCTKDDSIKVRSLNNILRLTKGYDFYLNDLKNKKSILAKYIVDKETFNNVSDSIFDYFNENKITYKKLLGEIDAINRINNKYSTTKSPSANKRKEYELKYSSRNWNAFNNYTLHLFKIQ